MEHSQHQSTMTTEEPADAAHFRTVKSEQPLYRTIEHSPTGSATPSITTAGATLNWALAGDDVFNPYLTRVKWSAALAAASAVSNLFNKLNPPIDALTTVSSTGDTFTNIQYADRAAQIIPMYTMPMHTYLSQPIGDLGTGGNAIEPIGGLSPSSGSYIDTGAITSNAGVSHVRAWRWDLSATNGDAHKEMPYIGPRYIIGRPKGNTATAIQYDFRLSEVFPHSFWALNKDIWIGGKRLLVEMKLAPITRIYARQSLGSATAVTTNPGVGSSTAATVSITLSNIAMIVYYESNSKIVSSVKSLCMGPTGIAFPLEFTTGFKNNVTTSTAHSFTIPLNISNGQRLKRIYWAAWHATESANTCWNHSNVNGVKITSYQTFLGGSPIQSNVLTVASKHDWEYMYPNIVGTPGALTFGTYRYNFVHIDSWVTPEKQREEAAENLVGYPLVGAETQYTMTATTPSASLNWYAFVITSKTFGIANGIPYIK